ncbi:hypothetical protein EIP86_000295 [Pleurotus ostreatoroseus]|nr:hypothetical protein EIP86_000295 [Pleurotus ostreatoroseus]
MAGHKRPHGAPVCPLTTEPKDIPLPVSAPPSASSSPAPVPSPLRREPSVILCKFRGHYINPHFHEDSEPPVTVPMRPVDRNGTPNTWVSTEPADDTTVKRERIPWDQIQQDPVDEGIIPAVAAQSPCPSASSSASSSSSTSTSLRRTFTELLRNSRPVASLFNTPREEVDLIAEEARRNGLFTGLIHRPHPPSPPASSPHEAHTTPIKREDVAVTSASPGNRRASGLERASSWWLVLGHSAEAVGHLVDMSSRNTLAVPERTGVADTSAQGHVAYASSHSYVRIALWDMLIVGGFGGLIVFYLLSVM